MDGDGCFGKIRLQACPCDLTRCSVFIYPVRLVHEVDGPEPWVGLVAIYEWNDVIVDVGVDIGIGAEHVAPAVVVGVGVLEVVEGHQGCHDIDAAILSDLEQAVEVVPVSGRCTGDDTAAVDVDADFAIAGNPDPRGVDAVVAKRLEMVIPPRVVEGPAKIIPAVPRRVGPIHENLLTACIEVRTGNRNPIAIRRPG